MKKCLIITGGNESPVKKSDSRFVIACDKGFEYANKYSLIPDLVIGDFDSLSEMPSNVPLLRLKPEKDDTDTMVAIKYALDHGLTDITLTCALGGRIDHAYANIQSALYAINRGAKFSISEKSTRIDFIKNGEISLPKLDFSVISVFSLTEKSEGVTVKGTKYTLECATLTSDFPLGVSNEWSSDTAEISVENGILMIIQEKDR